jgi:hypothetical protein
MSDRCEEIDAARLEAFVEVLSAALPRLVAEAYAAFRADKFAVSTIATGLSDAEWRKIKRNKDRRRACKRQQETTNEITGGNIGSPSNAGIGKP